MVNMVNLWEQNYEMINKPHFIENMVSVKKV